MKLIGSVARLAGVLTLGLTSVPVAAAHFWLDSRFDLSQARYHSPEEACIVGELARRTNGYQEGGNQEHRWGAAFIGQDQGLGERVCRGVIYGRFFSGGFWLPVETVDTLVYETGGADACTLPNYTDPETGQCGPPKCADECCAGCANGTNPIHSASGNKHQVERDFDGTGPFPLRFMRVYDSQRILFNRELPLGVGWTHSYGARIYVVPDANAGGSAPAKAYVYRPDGRIQKFTRSGSDWAAAPDISERLTVTLDGNNVLGATYTTNDDIVESYDAQGRIISLTNRDGFVQSLSYTTTSGGGTIGHNEVQRISNPNGRALGFAYDTSGALTSITDENGKTITYGRASGNLVSATYPDEVGTRTRTYHYNEAGQTGGVNRPNALTGITDETNQRFASWSYAAGGQANLSVHGPFLSGTIDRTSLLFNSNGTTTVTDGHGQQRVFAFGVQHLVARVTSLDQPCDYCAGSAKTKTYDTNGYPASARDFRDTDTLTTYNSRGLETQRIEASTVPDPGNPPNRITPPEKRTTNTVWNTSFRVPTQRTLVNRNGVTEARTDWFYNARGQPTARCDYDVTIAGTGSYVCSAAGIPPTGIRRTTTTYCDAVNGTDCPLVGLVKSVNGPRLDVADTTTYAYRMADDPATPKKYRKGDLWKVTNALGHVTEYQERDGNGRPTKVLDANGVITQMAYHPRGWLAVRTVKGAPGINGGADAVTTLAYDDVGNVSRVTQPDGSWLGYDYDVAHRLTSISDNLGNSIEYTLDDLGNRTAEETYASGNATPKRLLTRAFDTLNRLTDQYDAQARATHFAYDGNGNRTDRTDPTTVDAHQVYDPLNRLKATLQDYQGSDPSTADATTQYAYDTRDNLRQVVDPNALATNYTFDGLDRLDTLASPDTGTSTYLQDAAGNRTQQTDARGAIAQYSHDALDRLVAITYPTHSAVDIDYAYDQPNAITQCAASWPIGRLTQMSDESGTTTWCYDHRGNVIRKTVTIDHSTYAIGYAYDLADRLMAIDYPNGTRVEYSRDALGRISAVRVRPTSGGTLTTVVSSITYQPFGPAMTYAFAAGSQSLSLTHDQNYWVTDVGGSVLNLHFCRDGVANITRLKTSAPACAGTPSEQYAYDALYRLTQVQNGSGGVVEAYSYNLTGDRLGKTRGGVTEPYTYPSPFTSHHLLGVGGDARLYDAAGNLVEGSTDGRDWTYDERNRLVNYYRRNPGLGANVDYQYNGRGERVAKSGSFSGHYVYGEGGLLLTDAGGGTPFGTNYVYADGRPVALVRGSTLYYVHADHLGTPRAVTAAGSASPMWSWAFQGNPFGEQAPAALVPMNLRFPGQYFDPESGQHYNYFRDYEPETGRYVESDPIGLEAGLNTYAYVAGRPLLLTDAEGLDYWVEDADPSESGLGLHQSVCVGKYGTEDRFCISFGRKPGQGDCWFGCDGHTYQDRSPPGDIEYPLWRGTSRAIDRKIRRHLKSLLGVQRTWDVLGGENCRVFSQEVFNELLKAHGGTPPPQN